MSLFNDPYPLTSLGNAGINESTGQSMYDYIIVGGQLFWIFQGKRGQKAFSFLQAEQLGVS